MYSAFGFTQIKSDQIVNEGHTLLAGFIIEASADPGDVSLYEGLDASSGRYFGKFKGLTNDSKPIIFPVPVYFDRGLFVDVGSNVTGVTLIWAPA